MTIRKRKSRPARASRRGRREKPAGLFGWRRFSTGDLMLGAGLAAVVGFAVYLPIDVALNSDRYAPPQMQFSRGGQVPPDVIAATEGRAPLFDFAEGRFIAQPAPDLPIDDAELPEGIDPTTTAGVPDADRAALPDGVDPMTTGSVSSPRRVDGNGPVYTLVDARGGTALIADRDGIYVVRRGAMLPDGRRVLAVSGQGAETRISAVGLAPVLLDPAR